MHQLPAEVSMGLMVVFIGTVHLPNFNKTGDVGINVSLMSLLATTGAVEKQ